jgi:hypothetical protein
MLVDVDSSAASIARSIGERLKLRAAFAVCGVWGIPFAPFLAGAPTNTGCGESAT